MSTENWSIHTPRYLKNISFFLFWDTFLRYTFHSFWRCISDLYSRFAADSFFNQIVSLDSCYELRCILQNCHFSMLQRCYTKYVEHTNAMDDFRPKTKIWYLILWVLFEHDSSHELCNICNIWFLFSSCLKSLKMRPNVVLLTSQQMKLPRSDVFCCDIGV